jgi:hypothetical protein
MRYDATICPLRAETLCCGAHFPTVKCLLFQPSPHYVCETLAETDTVDTNIVLANKGT